MKFFVVSIMLACLVLPVFGQDTNSQRYQSLSNNMGTTISNSNNKLKDVDQQTIYNGNGKTFAQYSQRYNSLAKAIQDSEIRLERLIQARAPANEVKEERDKYEGFVKQLESVKSDYDEWLKSTQS
ncbi:MAG: hypothetical protein LBG76_01370 [Treponema sp.]|jgi:predicted aldo/keto reductase-like oxidoreductase|nr:hypothetical protein [Treponema sp.]